MHSQRTKVVGLASALALAMAGCSGGNSSPQSPENNNTPPQALSIEGTLSDGSAASQGLLKPVPSMLGPVEAAVDFSQLLVSCVTFTNPPVAGSGGTVDTDGKFTVSFPDGTVGANFGCFISMPSDDSFIPIPMVFVDPTQRSLSGDQAKTTRLAVTDSITIPAVILDLDAGTAEVDVTSIQKTDSGSTEGVVKTATGEKFDFTGNWIIGAVTESSLPAGYVQLCTQDEAFEDYWTAVTTQNWGAQRCNGPQVSMPIYMQRITGKTFTPDAQCVTAAAAADQQGTPLTSCNGTVGTDDRYAIQMWATGGGGGDVCQVSHPAQAGDDTHDSCKTKWLAQQAQIPAPEAIFAACGRRLGFSNIDARAHAQVDLASDANYVASGASSSATDTHYYDGPFTFATSVTLQDSRLFGSCDINNLPCPPFSQAQNNVSEGWKLDHAQLMWPQQNNCTPVPVVVGGTPSQAWRCYGNYYPNCGQQPPADCSDTSNASAAFQENVSLGCRDATGKAIDFDNWNDFWCQPSDWMNGHECTTPCTQGGGVFWVNPSGAPTQAGYSISACGPKSIDGAASNFVPLHSGHAISVTGAIVCTSGGALFDASNPSAPQIMNGTPADPNPWQSFRPTQAQAGQLCADMLNNTQATGADLDRLKLAQLQCYAQAFQNAQDSLNGCTRDIQFNWGTQNWWEFVADNHGPTQARGEVMMELFNYTDVNAGSFAFINTRMEGVQVSDSSGYSNWVPCRVNEADSITVQATSDTELLIDMTTVISMVDRDNAACVAAVADGRIATGTQKMMFTMTKQ